MTGRVLGVAALTVLLALPAAAAPRPAGPRQDPAAQSPPKLQREERLRDGPQQDPSLEAQPEDTPPLAEVPPQPSTPDLPDPALEASLKAQEEGSRWVLEALELLGVAQQALNLDPLETEVDWTGEALGALNERGVGLEKAQEVELLVAAEVENRRRTETLLGLLQGDLSLLSQPELLPQDLGLGTDLSALGNVPPDDD